MSLIREAHISLDIYNEEMNDRSVEDALKEVAERGVKVRVVMTNSSKWAEAFRELSSAGVQVRTFAEEAPLYIHAKMILVDNRKVFIGSENFSTTSLERNRELGLIFSAPRLVSSLQSTFNDDFTTATPF